MFIITSCFENFHIFFLNYPVHIAPHIPIQSPSHDNIHIPINQSSTAYIYLYRPISKVQMGHDPARIPSKSEWIPNPIQQEHEHHSTHGHQENLRPVQKWQHPVSQMRDVDIMPEG